MVDSPSADPRRKSSQVENQLVGDHELSTFVDVNEATKVRVEAHNFESTVYFGARDVDGPGPQIYVNELDPGVELAAHFHKVDQFQVFFGGNGATFLRKSIPDLMVHYTDAYSTYGPFRAAIDHSLAYATIRAHSSNFGGVMPGARAHLPYRGRRHASLGVDGWTVDALPSPGNVEIDELLHDASDALQVRLVKLGPQAFVTLESPSDTSGRSYCIVSGEIVWGERLLGDRTIGWSDSRARGPELRGGLRGCGLLILDFPAPATPDQHGPSS
jgi:hypothetical protein